MARAIDKISRKYQDQVGIHIGGIDHLESKGSSKRLQTLEGAKNITLVNLSSGR